LGALSTFKTYPEPDVVNSVSVHVAQGVVPLVSTATDSSQAASPSVRTPSPIFVNLSDSPAKQRKDLAAINVRRLKKERAGLEDVKAAVAEFVAAKAAHEQELLAPSVATRNPEDVPRGERAANGVEPATVVEPVKVETQPAEEGVMNLPVMLTEAIPSTERKTSGLTVPKSAEVNAALDQVRIAKQSGSRGGKGRKGVNQGGS
jgi:hypothetical protein